MTAAVELIQAEVRGVCQAVIGRPIGLLVVAVSGGADSTCLLHACASVLPPLGGRVAAVHVDHGLRGEASRADACSVAGLTEKLGVPLEVVRRDVGATARQRRLGLEQAGRQARYAALAASVARTKAWGAATGHNRDDQAETVLLHLLRGSGPTGLGGMPVRQELSWASLGLAEPEASGAERPVLRVLRPLLTVPRVLTEAYCREAGLTWRFDESNLDPSFVRNRIRHQLLPLLATYNPAIVEHLAGLADIASDDAAALDKETAAAWCRVELGPSRVQLSWSVWLTWPRSLQRRVLRKAAAHLTGAVPSLRALESARRLMSDGRPGLKLSLNGGLLLQRTRAGLELTGPPAGEQPRSERSSG
jgi:tRNA(Ile)-lysidine synthase